MSLQNVTAIADELVRLAVGTNDGCQAISFFDTGNDLPAYTVLVATAKNPKRLAALQRLHDEWYPEGE